jgi:hypothetical protein
VSFGAESIDDATQIIPQRNFKQEVEPTQVIIPVKKEKPAVFEEPT